MTSINNSGSHAGPGSSVNERTSSQNVNDAELQSEAVMTKESQKGDLHEQYGTVRMAGLSMARKHQEAAPRGSRKLSQLLLVLPRMIEASLL